MQKKPLIYEYNYTFLKERNEEIERKEGKRKDIAGKLGQEA